MSERMIIDGESRPPIKMTRSMGEDIGWKALFVLENIEKKSIDFSYSLWQWFIAHFWFDDVSKGMLSIVVRLAKNDELNLNKNQYFLDFIFEKTALELDKKMGKGVHPIVRQAFMDIINKKRPEPKPDRQAKDIWD